MLIRQDFIIGEVNSSPRPVTWETFIEALELINVPEDFLGFQERDHGSEDRDAFRDGVE